MWTTINVKHLVRGADALVAECLDTFATDAWVLRVPQTDEAAKVFGPSVNMLPRH